MPIGHWYSARDTARVAKQCNAYKEKCNERWSLKEWELMSTGNSIQLNARCDCVYYFRWAHWWCWFTLNTHTVSAGVSFIKTQATTQCLHFPRVVAVVVVVLAVYEASDKTDQNTTMLNRRYGSCNKSSSISFRNPLAIWMNVHKQHIWWWRSPRSELRI